MGWTRQAQAAGRRELLDNPYWFRRHGAWVRLALIGSAVLFIAAIGLIGVAVFGTDPNRGGYFLGGLVAGWLVVVLLRWAWGPAAAWISNYAALQAYYGKQRLRHAMRAAGLDDDRIVAKLTAASGDERGKGHAT
jgi:hypothetical protein